MIRTAARLGIAVLALLVSITFGVAPAQADHERAVIFVLDTSGSMKGEKLEAAKTAVERLAEAIPEDVAIGLVTFANSPDLKVAPTLIHDALTAGLREVRANGNTAMYDAILLARTAAMTARGSRAVIVIGDGEDTASVRTLGDVRAADWGSIRLSIVGVDFTTFDVVSRQFSRVVEESGGLLISVKESERLAEALRLSLEQSGIIEGEASQPVPAPLPELLDAPLKVVDHHEHLAMAALSSAAVFASTFYLTSGIRRRRYEAARRGTLRNFTSVRETAQHTSLRIPRLLLDRNAWLPAALDRAGLSISPVVYRYRQLALWFGLLMVLRLLGLAPFLALLLSLILSAWLPRRYLRRLHSKRRESFQNELPDFLSITASALRAGLPISQAIEASSQESAGELGRQMTRALQEMALGSGMDVALRGVADRLESDDFAWLVTAIEVQRRVGGNLSEILDVAAVTVRSRLELKQEIKTLAAEGQLSAKVLTALPTGLFLFLVLTRRDFVAPLWETTAGLLILGFAVALIIAGYQWIRRLSKLEV